MTRKPEEGDFSVEEEICKQHGLEYVYIQLENGGIFIPQAIDKLNDMLDENEKTLIHCASANRIGGWFISYLVKKKGMDFDSAVELAQTTGLSNPGFISQMAELLGE